MISNTPPSTGLNGGSLKLLDPPEVDEGPCSGGAWREGFLQCVTPQGEQYDLTPPRVCSNVQLGNVLVAGPRRVNGPDSIAA